MPTITGQILSARRVVGLDCLVVGRPPSIAYFLAHDETIQVDPEFATKRDNLIGSELDGSLRRGAQRHAESRTMSFFYERRSKCPRCQHSGFTPSQFGN